MSIIGEKGVRRILLVTAFSALSALLLIALFIINEGVPFIFRYGLRDFLFSSEWKPTEGKFGIFPMLAASVWVTLGAMAVGAPLGIASNTVYGTFVFPYDRMPAGGAWSESGFNAVEWGIKKTS